MKITVIIVNWNTGKLLAECLQSIASVPDASVIAEVIVVDNNSADHSFAQAKKVALPMPVMMMGLHQNIGFAAANNMAIRARRTKDSHVFLLNPDTQVLPGAIGTALMELEYNNNAGIVGLRLVNMDNTTQPSVRNFPNFLVLVFFFLKLNRLFPQATIMEHYLLPTFNYSRRQCVEQVMGAAFLIRQVLLKEVGLLDEKFWVWFEEVDYCKRVDNAGWEIVYTPAGTIKHHGGVSFSQWVGLKKNIPFFNSCLYYAKKHLGLAAYVVLLGLWPIAVIISIPAVLIHLGVKKNNKI